jgi:hypothetical protein
LSGRQIAAGNCIESFIVSSTKLFCLILDHMKYSASDINDASGCVGVWADESKEEPERAMESSVYDPIVAEG